MRLLPCLILALGIPVLAQTSGPFIPGSILTFHAASRRDSLGPAAGFAPGSLCYVSTGGLYPPYGEFRQGEKVSLRFRAPGDAEARDLTIVEQLSSTSFTVRIPVGTSVGAGEMIAVAESGKVYPARVWIAPSGFGIYTKTREGFGAAAAQVWRGESRTVGLTTPAQPRDWVTIWGTGLGNAQPTVEVAGIRVAPAYAGPAPGLPGIDQINFQFPAGVPEDCYIPLAVTDAGGIGVTVSIAAAAEPGPCRHRLGLSAEALATLDQGGTVPLSQSWVNADVQPGPERDGTYRRIDSAVLDFMQPDAARVQVMTGLLTTPAAGCQLYSSAGGLLGAIFNSGQILDSGTPTLNGPGGVSLAMRGFLSHFEVPVRESSYPLDKIPPSTFVAGDWAFAFPGGRDTPAFEAGFRLPPPLRWTNRATFSPVSRTRDLELKWDPSGYSDEWVQGGIYMGNGSIVCQAPASAGSITMPAALLAQLPDANGNQPLVQLLLTPAVGKPALYQVPLVQGGSFQGIANFSFLESVFADLQ